MFPLVPFLCRFILNLPCGKWETISFETVYHPIIKNPVHCTIESTKKKNLVSRIALLLPLEGIFNVRESMTYLLFVAYKIVVLFW